MRGRPGRILVVTGTGTEVGKTVVTAAVAALAVARGERVAVLKPAQTGVGPGDLGDLAHVARLVPAISARELGRFSEPLAPATAARRAGADPVTPAAATAAAVELVADHDLVIVEGAGGVLVPFVYGQGSDHGTVADVVAALDAEVLVVAAAGLGTLNHTALTVEALQHRGLTCLGVVLGAWPAAPDLAARCNLLDLPAITGVPLLGAIPEGSGALAPPEFLTVARRSLARALGGQWQTPEA